MTNACQDITIHAVSFAHQGSPAFYASLPDDGNTDKGCGTNRAADQKHLLSLLLDHVVDMKNPHWQYRPGCWLSA